MSVTQLKGITPVFQNILIKQIDKAMEAIGEGDMVTAYSVMKILILSMKPTDRDLLLKNEVKHIDEELRKAAGGSHIDLHVTNLRGRGKIQDVLQRNVWELYAKVMNTLHKGDYLEIHRVIRRGQEM